MSFVWSLRFPKSLVPKSGKRRGIDEFSEKNLSEGLTLQLLYEPERRDSKGKKNLAECTLCVLFGP